MKARTNRILIVILLTLGGLAGCKSPPPKVVLTPLPFGTRGPATLQVNTFPDGLLIKSGAAQSLVSIASGFDPAVSGVASYQWQWSKNPVAEPGPADQTWRDLVILDTNFVAIAGATNSVYTIVSASASDVAYYRVRVTVGTNSVISKASPVWVWKNDDITVQGPIVTQNGITPTCPLNYVCRADMPYVLAGAGPYCACGNFSNCVIRWYELYLRFSGCGKENPSCVPTPLSQVFQGYYYGFTAYSPTSISGTFNLTVCGF
jgi:hypothetical protein